MVVPEHRSLLGLGVKELAASSHPPLPPSFTEEDGEQGEMSNGLPGVRNYAEAGTGLTLPAHFSGTPTV